jgi:HKD family nuclease
MEKIVNTKPEIFEWFHNDHIPGIFKCPAIISGGTYLLREFLDYIELSKTYGELSMAVPFISPGIFKKMNTWNTMDHRAIKLLIVTKTLLSARIIHNELGIYPWKSFEIRILNSLHAKIYVFTHQNFGGACLIGSQNLSVSAIMHNDEAGMLFLSNINDEVNSIIHVWHRQIEQLARRAVEINDETDYNNNINLS